MREAIGGTVLLQIVMIFIVIYVAFLAIAINYSISFRVKNNIINIIEEYEGLDNAEEVIQKYISSVGYYKSSTKTLSAGACDSGTSGYCIKKITATSCNIDNIFNSGKCGSYYRVTTYISFDFPILGDILQFPVSGETKVIYND